MKIDIKNLNNKKFFDSNNLVINKNLTIIQIFEFNLELYNKFKKNENKFFFKLNYIIFFNLSYCFNVCKKYIKYIKFIYIS